MTYQHFLFVTRPGYFWLAEVRAFTDRKEFLALLKRRARQLGFQSHQRTGLLTHDAFYINAAAQDFEIDGWQDSLAYRFTGSEQQWEALCGMPFLRRHEVEQAGFEFQEPTPNSYAFLNPKKCEECRRFPAGHDGLCHHCACVNAEDIEASK